MTETMIEDVGIFSTRESHSKNYFWWGHVLTTKHVEPSLQDKHVFAEEEAGLFEELFSLKHQNITFNEICIHIVHSNDDQINAQMLNPLYTDNTSVANASTNIGKP